MREEKPRKYVCARTGAVSIQPPVFVMMSLCRFPQPAVRGLEAACKKPTRGLKTSALIHL